VTKDVVLLRADQKKASRGAQREKSIGARIPYVDY
jgi:hypothetical protein